MRSNLQLFWAITLAGIGLGLCGSNLARAESSNSPAGIQPTELRLRCLGTYGGDYTPKSSGVTEKDVPRSVDVSVTVTTVREYIMVEISGDDILFSISNIANNEENVIDHSNKLSWDIYNNNARSNIAGSEKFREEYLFIDRISGRLSAKSTYNSGRSVLNHTIEAVCSKLDSQKPKF